MDQKETKYDEIFARSFSRHDQKRFGYTALVVCFIVTCCLCTVFKPYLAPLPAYIGIKETKLLCNTTKPRSDTCMMKGDVRIQGNSSTIFVLSSHVENASWTIKPYARKGDEKAMQSVTNFSIKAIEEQAETMPKCTKMYNEPAIVFSVGGYGGNNFHAFTDVIIPLYATSREFNREVRFLVANKRSQWTTKFQKVLDKLSRYENIDIDNDNQVHCFPSMIVGLNKEDRQELHTDSMNDFIRFLRSSYSLERSTTIKLTNSSIKRPRLLIVSRQKTRAFMNLKDVVGAAQEMGFEVIVTEMNANMTQVSRLVNSCDVMMGVHGAGLTNMVFLPENGVVIQVVPCGKMEWLANTDFGEPSKAMGLKYLEYKISEEESTLIDQYPHNHQVFRDPGSIQRKGWGAFRSIYLDKQNVKLDVAKFKETLSKALELLH
ncbi:hypothetical protein Ccrd_017289 [Cynara cardunculus var. scolymus]|uniref:Glycosyltransferase 61 catalytic domain-containing protein n=1 Tax=Cynara cardunculus var. scolymus TaxID=59895 RepID=A0A124SFU5_CYNCS|nr:hypothetical protein Ccrd_017289 [Cynara cardunculus var. scolymus]